MAKIVTQCPCCHNTALIISKIECAHCNTVFEGSFEMPLMNKLSETDLAFVIDFVKCSGSLKEMATKHDISYPTLRNRLNELIITIEKLENAKQILEDEILNLLEEGKITAKEASIKLRKLRDKS